MNEHQIRVEALIEQVLMTIREPYESVRWMLGLHGFAEMGDSSVEGSGAWHFEHLCEVFRIHVKAFMGAEAVAEWPTMPESLEDQALGLDADAQRFADWCRSNPERVGDVTHGEKMRFEDMIGVMHRHIVWHAAAVHYWCLWKSSGS
jgi:hypothetical protein